MEKIRTERCSDADDGSWVSAGTGAAEAAPREAGGCWLGLSVGQHRHLAWRLLLGGGEAAGG